MNLNKGFVLFPLRRLPLILSSLMKLCVPDYSTFVTLCLNFMSTREFFVVKYTVTGFQKGRQTEKPNFIKDIATTLRHIVALGYYMFLYYREHTRALFLINPSFTVQLP